MDEIEADRRAHEASRTSLSTSKPSYQPLRVVYQRVAAMVIHHETNGKLKPKFEDWIRGSVKPQHQILMLEKARSMAREQFGKRIGRSMWGMIREWPTGGSRAKLEVVRQVLVPDLPSDSGCAGEALEALLKSTKESIQDHVRLLPTSTILSAYQSLVEALLFIEPTGLILESVEEGIQEQLKSRPDVLDELVRLMLSEEDTDIRRSFASRDYHTRTPHYEEEVELPFQDWGTWVPDPVNAKLPWHLRAEKDALSRLLRLLGAHKVLQVIISTLKRSMWELSVERLEEEVAYMERRFGKDSLQEAKSLVKDASESSALQASIKQGASTDVCERCQPIIGSILLWSHEKDDEPAALYPRIIPEPFRSLSESYESEFRKHRPGRRLVYDMNTGKVSMTVRVSNGPPIKFCGSVKVARVLGAFSERDEWTSEDFAEHFGRSDGLHMELEDLRSAVQHWIDQGIIEAVQGPRDVILRVRDPEDPKEAENVNSLADVPNSHSTGQEADRRSPALPYRSGAGFTRPHRRADNLGALEGTSTASLTPPPSERDASTPNTSAMDIHWALVTGVLQSRTTATVDKLHSILLRLALCPKYTGNETELYWWLENKVSEGKLLSDNGIYRLNTGS